MKNEKEMTRSIRRHHVARLKRVRGNYYRYTWNMTPRQLGKVVATPRCCSCGLCGNPRVFRWLSDFPMGRTFQEVKQLGYAESSHDELWQKD